MNLKDFRLKEQPLYGNGPLKSILYTWFDKTNPVATVRIEYWPDLWISCSGLKIFELYRGNGLSHQVMDFCEDLGVNNLSVSASNTIAIKVYKKHGFVFTGEHDGKYLRMKRRITNA